METEKIEMIKKERIEYSDQAKRITTMESVLRTMMKMTGKSEEELRNEMRQELEELEREVSALKELLKTKPTPKAKGGKKKAETEGEEQKAEKEEKPKKAKAAPKKKAVVAAEASVVSITEGAAVTDEEVTVTEVKEEKPKAKKAAPKKKAAAAVVVATEATEGEVSEVKEEKPKAKKAAPKKKAEVTEGEEKPKAKKAAPKKKAAAAAVVEVHEPELMQELEREMPTAAVTATEEDEEVEVEEIEYDGVKYLRSVKGIVYDIETSEEIGRWNEETKSIEVE